MPNLTVFVAGTFDTKSHELNYLKDTISNAGVAVKTIDLSTTDYTSNADVSPQIVAEHHPEGAGAVFTGDRGTAVAGMALAFENWSKKNASSIGGMISAGGSGGTALVTPALQTLPIGTPKIMVSTVASGNVEPYVGPSDIMMMYSVTDVQGLNTISRRVLGSAAAAMAGAVLYAPAVTSDADEKPGVGMTMFGVTTAAVQSVVKKLENEYEPFVFHATGVGGRSMEKLADGGFFKAVIDLTTTEVCDMLFGGVFAASEDRFGAIIRQKIPYVGSVGALDMVNFGAPPTVPAKYADRLFYEHNPQVTLMRTTLAENAQMGQWIAGRLNQMDGPVRFLLPLGGLSALDAPDMPFNDDEARTSLYDSIRANFSQTSDRRLIEVPHHINSTEFSDAVVDALQDIT